MPGLKVIVTPGGFSRTRPSNTTHSISPKKQSIGNKKNSGGVVARTTVPNNTAWQQTKATAPKPAINPKSASTKKKLTQAELDAIQVGSRVSHKKFGEGVITTKSDRYLLVMIGGKERKFMWPGAFEDGFLKLV